MKVKVAASAVVARPLHVSRSLAADRATESKHSQPLFKDAFAAMLAETGPKEGGPYSVQDTAYNVIATKFLDNTLTTALGLTNVNTINKGDYRQVVLLGDGMDTRAYRLLLPTGTLVFQVSPAEVHELAEAVLAQAGVKMQAGCLLRRVNADLKAGTDFAHQLELSGYRPDRLSIWIIQGLHDLGLSPAELQSLLGQLGLLAAYNSLVAGELPAMDVKVADVIVADAGLTGAVLEFGEEAADFGRWDPAWQPPPGTPRRVLFTAQQMRMSAAEVLIYQQHVQAAEAADEDFMGNFS